MPGHHNQLDNFLKEIIVSTFFRQIFFLSLTVVLIKKILLFILSIVFTIFLLIGATTSYAKDEFDTETKKSNYRFYTIDWIEVVNENNKKYVCGTKVSTFDASGRKYHLEYHIILMNDDSLVTRLEVDAVQISFEKINPIKTDEL